MSRVGKMPIVVPQGVDVTAGAETTLKALDAVGTSSGAPKEPITITSVRITES